MMTLHKLHAGDGYTYLTRQVAAGDEGRSPGQQLTDYYTASGQPPAAGSAPGRRTCSPRAAGPDRPARSRPAPAETITPSGRGRRSAPVAARAVQWERENGACPRRPVVRSKIEAQEARGTAGRWPATTWSSPR